MGARSSSAYHHQDHRREIIALTILTLWSLRPLCQCMTRAHLHITFAQRMQKPARYEHNAAHKAAHHAHTRTVRRNRYAIEACNINELSSWVLPQTFLYGDARLVISLDSAPRIAFRFVFLRRNDGFTGFLKAQKRNAAKLWAITISAGKRAIPKYSPAPGSFSRY